MFMLCFIPGYVFVNVCIVFVGMLLTGAGAGCGAMTS